MAQVNKLHFPLFSAAPNTIDEVNLEGTEDPEQYIQSHYSTIIFYPIRETPQDCFFRNPKVFNPSSLLAIYVYFIYGQQSLAK